MLTIITATGGRAWAFARLVDYINAQTYTGDIRWIVVDDVRPLTPVPDTRPGIVTEKIVPDWIWQPGMNTQAASMALALSSIEAGPVLVMEDDDAYLPDYIETMVGALEFVEMAGERVARYYNVATRRCKEIGGSHHASLASTALRGAALDVLRRVCESGSRRIDMDLWRAFTGPKRLLETSNVIGIKGLQGRGGIGVGHKAHFGDPDPEGETLIHWLGHDRAKPYLEAAWH